MNSLALEPDNTSIAPTAEAIRTWLCSRIATTLGIQASQVDLDTAFDRYGMDSEQTVSVTSDLAQVLGVEELPPTLLYDYPTVNQLTAYLVATTHGEKTYGNAY
jgi:acyl carrier protein